MIIYYLVGIIILLSIWDFYLVFKYIHCKNNYNTQNDMCNYYKNKLSMIEYHYRNYREGRNAYTVLRNIGNVLQGYYSKKFQDFDE